VPLILIDSTPPPAGGTITGTVTLQARTTARSVAGFLTLTARTGTLSLTGAVTLAARTNASAANLPVSIRAGRAGLRTRVSSNYGRVIDWDYSQSRTGWEVNATVTGDVTPSAGDPLSITVTQENERGEITRTFTAPLDGESRMTTLPGGARVTRLRATTDVYRNLIRTKLPEFIWWHENPGRVIETPTYRSETRGRIPIHDILAKAIPTLALARPVLAEEAWEETRRDYATNGRNGEDVWNDTYGLLNAELVLEEDGAWRGFLPGEARRTVTLPEAWTAWTNERTRATLQYPTSVTVHVADLWTRAESYLRDIADDGMLPDPVNAGDDSTDVSSNDQEAAQFEAHDGWEMTHAINTTDADGNAVRTVTFVEKTDRRVTRSLTGSVGHVARVAFFPTEEGQTTVVTVTSPALLSLDETTYAYLTRNGQTIRTTTTAHHAYAYQPLVEYKGIATLPGPLSGALGTPYVGDLITSETTRVDHVWSDYGGFLRERVTTETRLGTLEQTEPMTETPDSVPPTPLSVLTFVTTEAWSPVGDGYWLYTRRKVGPRSVIVHDAGTREAVKTMTVTGVVEPPVTEVTQNAPPMTDEPELPSPEEQRAAISSGGGGGGSDNPFGSPFPTRTYLQTPQEDTVPLGGSADAQTLTLPFVERQDQAAPLGVIWAGELKPQTRRSVTLASVTDARVRDDLAGFGLVRSVRAGGVGAAFRMTLETEDRDA